PGLIDSAGTRTGSARVSLSQSAVRHRISGTSNNQLSHPRPQSTGMDTQQDRGSGWPLDPSAGLLESFENQASLAVFKRLTPARHQLLRVNESIPAMGGAVGFKAVEQQRISGADDCCSLDHIPQFTYIARPRIGEQCIKAPLGDRLYLLSKLCIQLFHEMHDQRGNVLFAVP